MSAGTGLKDAITRNHYLIIQSLDCDIILPSLQSGGVLTSTEVEIIDAKITGNAKCAKIMAVVHKKGISDPNVYQKFMNALNKAEESYGSKVKFIIESILSARDDSASRPNWSTPRSEEQKFIWLHNRHMITESLDVSTVIDWLISKGVVDHMEAEEISSGDTMVTQAKRLVKVVERKGAEGYVKFQEALDQHGYSELASLLSTYDNSESVEVEEILKKGEVPPLLRSIHVRRPQVSFLVRRLLCDLQTTDGWVVVYGMAGCGKSVLAAETLRDSSLLKEVFPGGVFWVDMGEGTTSHFDEALLLMKMQNLILRLDKSRYQPRNLEAAQSYLQRVILEQHPRCLLVLDNLWSADVAKYFSVRCRVLVTTRNAGVANLVQTSSRGSIDVSSLFSDEQLLQLLAKWVNKSPEELPPHGDVIVQLSGGSPMIISIIGALLRSNPTEARWQACNEKLQSRRLSIQLRRPPAEWQYPNMTLVHSIELSINSLDEELKKYFQHLVVLDYHVAISSEALAMLWDTDPMDAEDIMSQFVDWSLAQTKKPSGDKGYWSFIVHDLIIDYLRDTISEVDTRSYHQGLVNKYRAQCNGDFTMVTADGYVHQQLLYHLEQIGDHVTRTLLLSDLRWLRACLSHCSASVVLSWYIRECIGEKCSDAMRYQRFLSQNMDKLVLDHNIDDIIQLALLLPETSPIYQQAAQIVESEELFWLCWNNKTSAEQALLLSTPIHDGIASHAQFSHDSLNVISCSSEKELKVWQHTTGSVVHNLIGHTDQVTHCVMSSSGRYIVSCSEDRTVKVWDGCRGRLIGECEGHLAGVQCCDVSHDERMIVSCDVSSTIKLWLLRTRELQHSWYHHSSSSSPAITPDSYGVTHCRFLGDGNYTIATCSSDGSIKVWSKEGKLCKILTGHSEPVNCINTRAHMMCSGGVDCTVRLWDTKNFECVGVLSCESYVQSCDFNRDGDRVITGEFNGHVKLWTVSDQSLLSLVTTHATPIKCVGYSPDNQLILSSNDMGVIKIHRNEWQEAGVAKLKEEPMKFYRRFAAYFHKDSDTGGYTPTMACLDANDKLLKLLRGKEASIMRIQMTHCYARSWKFTPDGTKLLIGFVNGDLQLVATETGDQLWMIEKAHSSEIVRCRFSLDGSRVVTVSSECHKVFRTSDGHVISSHSGYDRGVRLCHFLLDHVSLLSVQKECVVQLWNTDNGEDIRSYQFSNHDYRDAVILYITLSSPDAEWLAASTSVGVAIVWRVSDASVVTMTPKYKHCARVCAVNKQTFCVGYDDGTLRIWDISSGSVRECHTHTQYWMIDCAFSPDHSQIVTLSDSIKWWSKDGILKRTFFLKGFFGKHLLFSPDFNVFLTIDKIGTLYVLTGNS